MELKWYCLLFHITVSCEKQTILQFYTLYSQKDMSIDQLFNNKEEQFIRQSHSQGKVILVNFLYQ